MYILALDTSTESGSVALLNEGKVLSEMNINAGLNHSQTILPAVADVLKAAAVDISAVDLFAVTTGPGSFTGLRIGISLVKGFALASSKPVVGISTLDALALNLFAPGKTICPFMDAKRGQVYAGLYRSRPDGYPEKLLPETLEEPRRFLESIKTDVILLGNGISPFASLIEEVLSGRYLLAPPQFHAVRACSVGLLSIEKFKRGEVLDVMALTPGYLRTSEFQPTGSRSENA